MSGADRLEDGFPHGTPAGYDQGCKGGSCPEKVDGYQSCAEAKTRYAGDWTYRRRVDQGMTPTEIRYQDAVDARVAAEERKTAPVVAPVKPKAQKRAERKAQLARAASLRSENVVAATPDPVERKQPAVGVVDVAEQIGSLIPIELHGTTKGYSRGCRLQDRCPGVESVSLSCTDAMSRYQRRWREGRARKAAAAAGEAVDGGAVEDVETEPAEAQAPEVAPAEVLPEIELPVAESLSFLTSAAVVRVTPLADGGVEVTVRIGGAA